MSRTVAAVTFLLPLCLGVEQQMTGLYGRLASPSFPQVYPDNQRHVWNITVPKGHRIRLYFTHFSLESSDQCEYDFVQVFSEGNKTVRFCGLSEAQYEDAPGKTALYSAGDRMTVIFRSDYSNVGRFTGFEAFYSAEDINECQGLIDGEPSCDHYCHNYMGGFYCTCKTGYLLHSNRRSCTVPCGVRVLTQRSAVLTSPGYPGSYPNMSHCLYHIRLTEGFRLVLGFVEPFDVESHPEALCPYDSLKIITKTHQYGPYCGTEPPRSIRTGSHEADVIFITDASGRNKGWKIKYTSTATPCPNPLDTPHGIIHPRRPAYGFTDSFNVTCVPGYRLYLKGKYLSHHSVECQKDGTWDNPMPQCLTVDCGPPAKIPNGEVSVSTTTYGSTIEYTCHSPVYSLKDNVNGSYSCAQDGYWRNSLAQSRRPECVTSG